VTSMRGLVRTLKSAEPCLQVVGVGGPKMRAAGAEILIDCSQLAVIGVWEVLTHAKVIAHAFRTLRRELAERPPQLLILIDYPDFNLRLARSAKKLGIKVLYYISPQVWAWRRGRIQQIARLVDHMAVILPLRSHCTMRRVCL